MLSHICVYNLDMHFNCCNMWNLFFKPSYSHFCIVPTIKPTPLPQLNVPVWQKTEKRRAFGRHTTQSIQDCDNLLEGWRLMQRTNCETTKGNKTNKKRNWRESTENNTMVNYSLIECKTPTLSRPGLSFVFLKATVFFQGVRSLDNLGCEWGSSESEERKVRSGFGH